MSDLPKNVGKPHREAHRNYGAQSPDPGRSSNYKTPGQSLKQLDPVEFNQAAEKRAIQFMTEHIKRKGPPSFNNACALIALELDVSTETAKRYIRKYSVDHPKAVFIVKDGRVELRKSR